MTSNISPAGASKSKFRADIQALRGAAILLVLFYHANLPGLDYAGFLGVDLFFVISGFLITGIIRDGLDAGTFSFLTFYFRRAKRLLPAAFAVIAAVVIVSPFIMTELALNDLQEQVWGSLLFIANFVIWDQTGYFEAAAETKPLLHFWSLAVEEQYYFVMPLMLFFVRRHAWFRVVAAISIASFVLSVYLAPRYPDAAFYLPLTRMWELGLGSMAAIATIPTRQLRWISLARLPAVALLIIVPFFPTGLSHPGLDALLVCGATLIIILGQTGSSWETALPVKAMARIGDISYSLYLVHWPVLVFTRELYEGEPPLAAIWVALLLSVLISAMIYRFVEEPFRKSSPRSRRRFVGGLTSCAAAIAISPVAVSAMAAPDQDFEHIRRTNYGVAFECSLKPNAPFTIHDTCITNAPPRVLVWGDSYAMAWASALMGPLGELGMQQITMGACDPLYRLARFSQSSKSPYNRDYAQACLEFNSNVLDYAKNSDDIEIVVIAGRMQAPLSKSNLLLTQTETGGFEEVDVTTDRVTKALAALAMELHKSGKKAVFIAPPPADGSDIGDCLENKAREKLRLVPQSDCTVTVEANRKYRGAALDMMADAAELAEVELLDVFGFLCKDGVCRTEIDKTILYRDYSHLTYGGAALIGEQSDLAQDILTKAR
ncbi:Peptidoglycan/LPS O-acetylase OafA/YrhL, contains acyltransferase and SGNH-hydrolase domains [Marinobacter gudaonensis]|uniref:Peptidoglycan/LPS O-acetylase OafA/YrhL, contains acyltransferase and SGNH-hydrolase domains n=1 Tax=Marinobacter gudaonensis TaxID=375760 RepID=A0A1I6GJ07_9GAMM|nr:acyltransferase family protein [Marinobacter gudaonensis]SFR42158.1 Peptidoglycan/LPS O-acetylase OafA/YrhL, contains acyltransferase and SGNH-hydrolase domains [Marinobacter gudaonensis]